MAAIGKVSKSFMFCSHLRKPNLTNLLSLPVLPALLLSCRAIASKLFVGGLSYYTTEQGLSEAFSQYGQVIEAKVVMDRVSDRSKGFGFVTYASEDEADKAIAEMDRKKLNGRVVFVDYAKPQRALRSDTPIARGPPNPVPVICSMFAKLVIFLHELCARVKTHINGKKKS